MRKQSVALMLALTIFLSLIPPTVANVTTYKMTQPGELQSNAGVNAGYEWLRHDDEMYYRKENEISEWIKFQN